MRKLNRRELIAGASVVAILGFAAPPYISSSHLRIWAHDELRTQFGEEIANHPDTASFLTDYLAHFKSQSGPDYRRTRLYFALKPRFLSYAKSLEQNLRRNLVRSFCTSTTAVTSTETDAPFAYVALYDPYKSPCSNQLTAAFART